MNLLNSGTKVPVYKESTGTKYVFAERNTKILLNMFWKWDSVGLDKDVSDYNSADADEKEIIEYIMMLFTQNEVMVSDGYNKLATIFKPTEIKNWFITANGTEVTHELAYSLFTETLSLPDKIYTDFLDVNVMSTKTTFLGQCKVKKYEEYKAMGLSAAEIDRTYRRDVAKMLAVYGGGGEGVTLYAQFALLLAFQFSGKYPGLCQIVEYSIRDEYTHFIGNCEIFREYIKENPDIWDDQLKFEIYESFRELVAYEEMLIDLLNPKHIKKEDIKNYIRYRADEALKELTLKPNYNVDNPLKFMEEVTGAILTDFFAGKVTSYSRKLIGSREALRAKLLKQKEARLNNTH